MSKSSIKSKNVGFGVYFGRAFERYVHGDEYNIMFQHVRLDSLKTLAAHESCRSPLTSGDHMIHIRGDFAQKTIVWLTIHKASHCSKIPCRDNHDAVGH